MVLSSWLKGPEMMRESRGGTTRPRASLDDCFGPHADRIEIIRVKLRRLKAFEVMPMQEQASCPNDFGDDLCGGRCRRSGGGSSLVNQIDRC